MNAAAQTSIDDPRIAKGMQRQFALLKEREQGGARRIGWKVGFGAPAAKEKLKLAAPLIGFLLDRAVLKDGASVSLKDWVKPVAEPEIAVEMARDLPPGASTREIAQAIAAIGPAIELADLDIPPDDVEAILAGDIFQRHVLFGPRRPVELPGGLATLTAQVVCSGSNIAVPDRLEANTGPILDIVGHVSATLAAIGTGLKAGDVIITGSVTPPLMLEKSHDLLRWELAPIGAISVRFTS